jgi:hypothetical protein
MSPSPLPRACLLLPLAAVAVLPLCGSNVSVSRHWHLHQPIYWPEWNNNGPQTNRYQYGWDSLQIKFANGNRYAGSSHRHPQNNLVQGDPEGQFDAVFSPDDRVKAYQGGPKESLGRITDLPFVGYSMSYSGSLIENVRSFANNSAYGYYPSFNQNFIDMRNWYSQSGHRRLDLVGFTHHHSFGPLIPKSVLRKELQIFREIYWKTWAGNPDKSDHSRGFWPSEAAFSRHMVDVLVDEGYDWTIVANSHLSRTTQNFDQVAGLGNTTSNIDPPNRADRLGPFVPANQWWVGSLDGRGAWQAAPFAYQAHRVQYVNPWTGEEKRMTIVPMDDVISYRLGYSPTNLDPVHNHIAPFATDASRPVIVLAATDGENAWGGGYDSWQVATPDFLRQAHNSGFKASTIQKFLDDNPPPESALVHIEDGAWFNAANDWGHPQFVNWLYPPVTLDPAKLNNLSTRYDLETPGFSEDFRNWAVLMAGTNWMETAEQIWKAQNGPDSVQAWRIQEPYQWNGTYNNPNSVERGWHIFLGGFDSGFMYYGDSLDDEVKQTLASNRAIAQVRSFVEANLASDQTGPTIFKPQRFPWNPGGRGWGPLTLYRPVGFNGAAPWPSDFHIWTHVFDVSDVQTVTLRLRVDLDGVNSLTNTQNETFAGGPDVGEWVSIPMHRRVLPRGNPTSNSNLNFFLQPDFMADYYWAKITGYRDVLLDYYIEAVDTRGNVTRSDIQHVYVEDDGSATEPPPVPQGLSANPTDSGHIQLTWTAAPGASSYRVMRNGMQVGTTATSSFTDSGLSPSTTYTYTIVAVNGAGESDASDPVQATTPAFVPPFVLDGSVDVSGYLLTAPGMRIYAAIRGARLFIATQSPGSSGAGPNDHFVFVSDQILGVATTPAPWGKAGMIGIPSGKPMLAGESTNQYAGWQNTTAGTGAYKSASLGGLLAGELDLVQAFGVVPEVLYLAAASYATADGGSLLGQAPTASGAPNGSIEPVEFLAVPIRALMDADADNRLDRLQPELAFRARMESLEGGMRFSWAAVPGRRYQLQRSDRLGDPWQDQGTVLSAPGGADQMHVDLESPTGTSFWRVLIVD